MDAEKIHNVDDKRHDWVGSWEAEPLIYDALSPDHIGRTVIYRDFGRAEAGTLVSFRDGKVWARYSKGDTAAAANPSDLALAIRPLDGDLTRARA